uniref:C-type lectin domain-containing protein n=1 Tax=Acanthochromis polyacanthus TaxID=80966 RepID=A0A3Q1GH51_9TELE
MFTEAQFEYHPQWIMNVMPCPHANTHMGKKKADFVYSVSDTRIRVINQNATWEEALDYCEENHTSLLWIKDGNDQEAVKQWLEVKNITGTFWIGLRQSTLFGFWIWRDSPVFESNWKNDTMPAMPFSNQCGVINADYTWSDEDCSQQLPFICAENILKY